MDICTKLNVLIIIIISLTIIKIKFLNEIWIRRAFFSTLIAIFIVTSLPGDMEIKRALSDVLYMITFPLIIPFDKLFYYLKEKMIKK